MQSVLIGFVGFDRGNWASSSNQDAMEGFMSKDSWWTHARHLEEPQHANILPRILAGPVAGDSKYYEMLDLVIVLATIVHLLTLSAFCPSMLFQESLWGS